MNETMDAYEEWADIGDVERKNDFQAYVKNISDARYVTRRVLRIVDDQAKQHGLEPLLHQALLQVYGHNGGEGITVGRLADRLDVAAAFASRLTRRLEAMELVRREQSEVDRRSIHVIATESGVKKLAAIDHDVHYHVAYVQHQVAAGERMSALLIFAFYVGVEPSSDIGKAIRSATGL